MQTATSIATGSVEGAGSESDRNIRLRSPNQKKWIDAMSNSNSRRAALNLKLLIIIGIVGVLLVAGALYARKVRREMIAHDALRQAQTAYADEDWATASKMFRRYLARYPDDIEANKQCAHALLATRPLPPAHMAQAIMVYRRLLRAEPTNEEAFKQLVLLYETVGDYTELEHVARRRLEAVPHDPDATLELAKALVFRKANDEARALLSNLVAYHADDPTRHPDLVEPCILLSALPENETEELAYAWAQEWVARAITFDPQSGFALLQRAALKRELAMDEQGPAREELLAEARSDLERVQELASSGPRVRLLLCDEWIKHGEVDRARAQLELARTAKSEELRRFVVDPDTWRVALFAQAARLALRAGNVDRGVALAEEMLGELKDRPQLQQVVPSAVELLIAGHRVETARKWLDEHIATIELAGGSSQRSDTLIFLEALVAWAEERPYEVIRLLEPIANRPTAEPRAQTLLARAYMRTGQSARAARLLSETTVDTGLGNEAAIMLARLHLSRGNWDQARAAVRPQLAAQPGRIDLRLLQYSADLGEALGLPREQAEERLTALVDELEALRDAHPNHVDVWLLLASIAEARRGRAAAEGILEEAVDTCEQPLQAIVTLARLKVLGGAAPSAINLLRTACTEHGDVAAPWLALTDLLVAQDEIDAARAVLGEGQEHVKSEDHRKRLRLRQAALEIAHGAHEAGVRQLRELVSRYSDDIEVRSLLLDALDLSGDDRNEAATLIGELAELEGAETVDVVDGEIKEITGATGLLWRHHLARYRMTGADWRSQREHIEELLRFCVDADPSWTGPAALLGTFYERTGQFDQAEAVYRNGFEAGGSTTLATRWLALLQQQRKFTEFREVYERLSRRLDERSRASLRIQQALGEQRIDDAIKELELRSSGSQRNAEDLLLLARLRYEQTSDAEQALDLVDEALQVGATPVSAERVRAFILHHEGRAAEAEAALNALVAQGNEPEALLLRGSYHLTAGNYEKAEADFVRLAAAADGPQGYAALADFYVQRGDLDTAITAAEAGLREYPEAQLLRRGLAGALLNRNQPGDEERAQALLGDLGQQLPDDADALHMQAALLIRQATAEARDAARELMRRAAHVERASRTTFRGLVGIALNLEMFDTAAALSRKALQVHPDDTELRVLAAEAALKRNDYTQARRLAGQVRSAAEASDAQQLAAMGILADIALREDNRDTLLALLPEITERAAKAPEDESMQLVAARLHVALGQQREALRVLAKFCQTDAGRESLPALLRLEELSRTTGDMPGALEALERARRIAPNDPGVLRAKLLSLAARQEFGEVLKTIEAASPETAQADGYVLAAWILQSVPPHRDRAAQLFQQALSLEPAHPQAKASLALLRYQEGDVAEATRLYRELIKQYPMHADARNNLAWILVESGSALQEAIMHAREAVALQPMNPNYRDTLGMALWKSGELMAAQEAFLTGMDSAESGSRLHAKLLLHLGQVAVELGDLVSASQQLRKAKQLDEEHGYFAQEERDTLSRLLAKAAQES